jgi:hypothetical protein
MRLFTEVAAVLTILAGVASSQGASPLTLDSLARDLSRVESIRDIKDVQRGFAQLAQFGRWADMAALFADNGQLIWGWADNSSQTSTATGPAAIETWLRTDAAGMDGIQPGSLDTLIAESPIINLAVDGLSAKGRWNGLRFAGNGTGGTKIQGGVYENDYVLVNGQWKFLTLHYYPLYVGPYVGGWRNAIKLLPLVPYHYTADSVGWPIPPPVGDPPKTNATAEELAHRVSKLNDEDEVRNLQHAYGFYVDRRMWSDVVDLFVSNSTVKIEGTGTYSGKEGVRKAMELMGSEGLTQGINNDHFVLNTIVDVKENGQEAIARSTMVGMLGEALKGLASWEFSVLRSSIVKDEGIWKMKDLEITHLIIANYSTGWGNGGIAAPVKTVPPFVTVGPRSSRVLGPDGSNTTLVDVKRRIARSAAMDGAENMSNAYGYSVDDLRCRTMGDIFHPKGHKLFAFGGFYRTPERVYGACHTEYGGDNPAPMRASIAFHWRPQPVIHVSQDGRSASLRSHLWQPSTSNSSAGSFNAAIYNDQMALGDDGRWGLWSVIIDEFYWQSSGWVGGWSAAKPRNSSTPIAASAPASWTTRYPPDLSIAAAGIREATFHGSNSRTIDWPDIQHMWFAYRNPVSGRLPEYYWPGCVPCQAAPTWSLTANGYQEPPTGPTLINATMMSSDTLIIQVAGGPGDPVAGTVSLRQEGTLVSSTTLVNGKANFTLSAVVAASGNKLIVVFPGSDRLSPGQTTVILTGQ